MLMADSTCNLLRVEEIADKGRGLIAATPLKAGQVVLTESPLILYSSSPLISTTTPSSPFSYCHHCFRIISTTTLSCPSCLNHSFCSQKCLSIALKSSHSPFVCKALLSLLKDLKFSPLERQVQARFVVACYNLSIMSPSGIQTLLSLHGTPDESILDAANFLHSIISPLLCPTNSDADLSVDLIAQLLAKDRINSFCLMDPYSPNGPQRSIKAYGIYPKATMFNHDCLPNACRFDYVDTSDPGDEHNTDIVIRMIRDADPGEEVCISYFRIGRDYATRKRILMQDYGFTCGCDRCKVEASWNNGESQGGKNNSDLPHVWFLNKYVCDRKNCAGTLAPLPPKDDVPSNVLECNFCGNLKNDTD